MTNSSADELAKMYIVVSHKLGLKLKRIWCTLSLKTLIWYQLKNRSLFESPAREAIFWAGLEIVLTFFRPLPAERQGLASLHLARKLKLLGIRNLDKNKILKTP
jgi:hypothetical protein